MDASSPGARSARTVLHRALAALAVVATLSSSGRAIDADPPAESPGDDGGPTLPTPIERPPEGSWLDDWSILPLLFYSPETDLGFGLAVIRSLAVPEDNPSISTVALGVIYTTKGQFITRLEPDFRFGDTAFVHAVLRYQRYPTRFFGPGARLGDDGEPFDEETIMGSLDGRVTLTGRFRAGLRWDFRYNDVRDHVAGGVIETSGARGLERYFASGIGPVFSYDSRDEPRLPRRGLLAELRLIAFASATGSDYDALRADLDLRGYLALGCHVIAGQLWAQTTSGRLPFQLEPRLGGANFLRGWFEGHLRDRHALLGQLEWRFPIVGRLGGAAFVAVGEAVPRLDALAIDRLRAAAGGGVRWLLNQRQNVTIRLDFAYGDDFAAYFDVLEAF